MEELAQHISELTTYITQILIIINEKGQYFGLFLITLFMLGIYLIQKSENKELEIAGTGSTLVTGRKSRNTKKKSPIGFFILYGILSFGFGICPYVVWFYAEKTYPEMYGFWMLLWIVPIPVICSYGVCLWMGKITEMKKRWITGIAVVCIVAIAGTMNLNNHELGEVETESRMPAKVQEALEYVLDNSGTTEDQTVTLLGVDSIMMNARSYSARFIMPYGRDILKAGVTNTIHDFNSDEMEQLHLWMQAPENNLESIFEMAVAQNCQFVIFPDTITLPRGTWVTLEDGTRVLGIGEQYEEFVENYKAHAEDVANLYGYLRVKDMTGYIIYQLETTVQQ